MLKCDIFSRVNNLYKWRQITLKFFIFTILYYFSSSCVHACWYHRKMCVCAAGWQFSRFLMDMKWKMINLLRNSFNLEILEHFRGEIKIIIWNEMQMWRNKSEECHFWWVFQVIKLINMKETEWWIFNVLVSAQKAV